MFWSVFIVWSAALRGKDLKKKKDRRGETGGALSGSLQLLGSKRGQRGCSLILVTRPTVKFMSAKSAFV